MTDLTTQPWGEAAPTGPYKVLLERARASDSKVWTRLASWCAAPVVDTETLGFRARLHPRDNLSEKRILYTPGRFDPAELAYLRSMMGPDFTFVDLGANCGAYTFHLAAIAPASARLYAIEAQPEMARRFRFNLGANQFDATVKLDELAISDNRGNISFTINHHNRGESGLEGEGERITVPAMPLADYFVERSIERLDAMKIDVEGLEHRILAPFFDTVPKTAWPTCLIVEQLFATPDKDPVALAVSLGYRIERDLGRNVILVLNNEA